MSLNKHEYSEHTHELFTNSIKIETENQEGLTISRTDEGHQVLRLVLKSEDETNTNETTTGGIGLWKNNDGSFQLYIKMIGNENAEMVFYKDVIVLHNPNTTETDKIYKLDLCKWINKVNKALFKDQDLKSSSHDCIYTITA